MDVTELKVGHVIKIETDWPGGCGHAFWLVTALYERDEFITYSRFACACGRLDCEDWSRSVDRQTLHSLVSHDQPHLVLVPNDDSFEWVRLTDRTS